MTVWRRWLRQPQDVLLRKVLFQVHVWTGLSVGLYILMMCVTGSILVYRVELSRALAAQPRMVTGSGEVMSEEALRSAARRAHPGYEVADLRLGPTPNQAVEVMIEKGDSVMQRLLDPYTGEDLGYALTPGYRLLEWLLVLHDTLRLDRNGRELNAIGGLLLVVMAVTGAIIWWPGSRGWRRSLAIDTKANWRRMTWTIHSALGFWFFAFILMWGVTGMYLSDSEPFLDLADYLEPPENYEPDTRISDRIMYWLGYAHFGRFGGRIPGCGPNCDKTLKAVWAVVGLVPATMFVTGALMWWNRVLRPALRRSENASAQGGKQSAKK